MEPTDVEMFDSNPWKLLDFSRCWLLPVLVLLVNFLNISPYWHMVARLKRKDTALFLLVQGLGLKASLM